MFAVADPRAAMSLPWWRVSPTHHSHPHDFTSDRGHRVNTMLNDDGAYFSVTSLSDAGSQAGDLVESHFESAVQPQSARVNICRDDLLPQPNCVARMTQSVWNKLFRRSDSPPVRTLPSLAPVSISFCHNRSFSLSGDCVRQYEEFEGSSLAQYAEPIKEDPPIADNTPAAPVHSQADPQPPENPYTAPKPTLDDEAKPVSPAKTSLFNLFKKPAPPTELQQSMIKDEGAVSLEELAE